jgi:hypothetical protein
MPELSPDLTFFTVRCERHSKHFSDAYSSAVDHRYHSRYVHPIKWRLQLNACAPVTVTVTPPPPPNHPDAEIEPVEEVQIPPNVEGYEWHVEDEIDNAFHTVTRIDRGRRCDAAVGVRTLGRRRARLRVTLTVRFRDKPSASRTQLYDLQDFLVVSLGDSYAAGQGNPDKAGEPRFDQITTFGHCPMTEDPVWLEPAAHRSLQSGPSLAADRIDGQLQQADEHGVTDIYALTFLSFATSGAELEHLMDRPQHRWQRVSQIAEAKRTLAGRRIDGLIVSIGGNDLRFGEDLKSLGADRLKALDSLGGMKEVLIQLFVSSLFFQLRLAVALATNAVSREEIEDQINRDLVALPASYARLADLIRNELEPVNVFFTTYPTGLFDTTDGRSKACGIFDLPGSVGMSNDDINLIKESGASLNRKITESIQQLIEHPKTLLDVNRWHVVDGIAQAFAGHGYCTSKSERFFVQLEESCERQGDIDGTMHPNALGHDAYASHIEHALRQHMLPRGPSGKIRLLEVPGKLSFGNVVVGDTSIRQLTITNLGGFDERIEITGHQSSLFTWPAVNEVLKPGEEHSIPIVFEPGSAGRQQIALDVRHDTPNSLRRCEISGVGISGPGAPDGLTGDPDQPDIDIR